MAQNPVLQVAYTQTKSDRIKGILNQLQEEVPDEVGEEELMKQLLSNEEELVKKEKSKKV